MSFNEFTKEMNDTLTTYTEFTHTVNNAPISQGLKDRILQKASELLEYDLQRLCEEEPDCYYSDDNIDLEIDTDPWADCEQQGPDWDAETPLEPDADDRDSQPDADDSQPDADDSQPDADAEPTDCRLGDACKSIYTDKPCSANVPEYIPVQTDIGTAYVKITKKTATKQDVYDRMVDVYELCKGFGSKLSFPNFVRLVYKRSETRRAHMGPLEATFNKRTGL
jgi:hypothetical protein